ncbi:DUF6338 family protein [Frankia tisae]|uniref:DUF6338 family protein n=1 Tax=Frankia tisae TaxID=2950104 RepID=UPI0021C19FA7|nr:DUF6338 family protein [Frankia tisae]
MIETFQAIAVTALLLLPGALYTFACERQVGRAGAADQLMTFAGSSALFHALAAPITWWVYMEYIHSGRLDRGPLPWELWPVALGYTIVPALLGAVAGGEIRRRGKLHSILPGPVASPRAWDEIMHLAAERNPWVRVRLKDHAAGTNGWIVGAYAGGARGGPASFAAGFPQESDLYLSETVHCDSQGRFIRGSDGGVKRRKVGVLLRRDDILYLEIIW